MELGELARILHEQRLALPSFLEDCTWDMLEQMSGPDTAKVMHSMAKLHESAKLGKSSDKVLLGAMQGRATATAWELEPQDVANVLWALATMEEMADRRLLAAMKSRVMVTVGGYTPGEVATVLWALATMGEKSDGEITGPEEEWWDAMHSRVIDMAGGCTPGEVAKVLQV